MYLEKIDEIISDLNERIKLSKSMIQPLNNNKMLTMHIDKYRTDLDKEKKDILNKLNEAIKRATENKKQIKYILFSSKYKFLFNDCLIKLFENEFLIYGISCGFSVEEDEFTIFYKIPRKIKPLNVFINPPDTEYYTITDEIIKDEIIKEEIINRIKTNYAISEYSIGDIIFVDSYFRNYGQYFINTIEPFDIIKIVKNNQTKKYNFESVLDKENGILLLEYYKNFLSKNEKIKSSEFNKAYYLLDDCIKTISEDFE